MTGRHGGIADDELKVKTIGIREVAHQSVQGIGHMVLALTRISLAPAQLIAVVGRQQATLGSLVVTTGLDVPVAECLVGRARLVADRDIGDGHAVQVLQADITFRTFTTDIHVTRFLNACRTVGSYRHLDVKVIEILLRP